MNDDMDVADGGVSVGGFPVVDNELVVPPHSIEGDEQRRSVFIAALQNYDGRSTLRTLNLSVQSLHGAQR